MCGRCVSEARESTKLTVENSCPLCLPHCVALIGLDHFVLYVLMNFCLFCAHEAGAHCKDREILESARQHLQLHTNAALTVDPLSSQCKRRSQALSICNASRCNVRNLEVFPRPGHEDQASDVVFTRMTSTLEPVNRQHVHPQLLPASSMPNRCAFVHNVGSMIF